LGDIIPRALDDDELLAFVEALKEECKRLTDQSNPESLRASVDRKMRQRYESDDTGEAKKTTPIRIGDMTVGYHQLKYSKPKYRETVYQLQVEDYVGLAQWLVSVPDKYKREYIERDLKSFALWYFGETGEMPDGCYMGEFTTYEQPSEYIGSAIKVNPDDVLKAMQKRLPESRNLLRLLGGA